MGHISENIEEALKNFTCQPMGISTGFEKLDRSIWGLQPKKLITIGGRSGMGKSSILVDLALSSSKEVPVGIFSLEMPTDQLKARMAANLTDLNYHNVHAGNITKKEQEKFISAGLLLKDLPIYIEDENGILGIDPYWMKQRKLKLEQTMDYKIKKMVQDKGCKVIFIDYLQLVAYTNASMRDKRIIIGNITQELRDYAKRLNFCCILLCQLRRFDQSQYGTGKKKIAPMPKMDELKESGEIENHSDIVILLHRKEYYNEKKELNLTANEIEDDAILMLVKNRDGPTGNIAVEWHGFSMSYRDIKQNTREF